MEYVRVICVRRDGMATATTMFVTRRLKIAGGLWDRVSLCLDCWKASATRLRGETSPGPC